MSALLVLWLLTAYRAQVAATAKAATPNLIPADNSAYPSASVIVYAAGNPTRLNALLSAIFAQDYPAPMEAIVVNDGKNEEIKDVVTRLQARHRNLYITFTPVEARNLSRRKLALTLGIKAARMDIVVLTDDSCLPASNQWLRLMTEPLANQDIQLVIGHFCPTGDDTSAGASARRFSLGADAVEFLSAAIRGRSFRATGHNLAYRKELFFNNRGFSRSLNLHDGDDDIFINEVATPANTATAISAEAHMSVWHPDMRRAYRQEKTRRAFTARFLRKDTRRLFGLSSMAMWLWLALAVTVSVLSWPNLAPLAVELALTLILWIPLAMVWNRTLKALSCPVAAPSIPLRLLMRPFSTARFKWHARRHKADHYTWKNTF